MSWLSRNLKSSFRSAGRQIVAGVGNYARRGLISIANRSGGNIARNVGGGAGSSRPYGNSVAAIRTNSAARRHARNVQFDNDTRAFERAMAREGVKVPPMARRASRN